jgi:hypothetical protein
MGCTLPNIVEGNDLQSLHHRFRILHARVLEHGPDDSLESIGSGARLDVSALGRIAVNAGSEADFIAELSKSQVVGGSL